MDDLIIPQISAADKNFMPETFGGLTTAGPQFKNYDGKQTRTYQNCICECGKLTVHRLSSLRSGSAQSCGCRRSSLCVARSRTHGLSRIPAFICWKSRIDRCYNPKNQDFPNYGGRGIQVCERWKKFENFFQDMGEKPGPGFSLDRMDNNGNYEKSNCRWATGNEQANNKRNNRMITIGDKTDTLANWCRKYGMAYKCVHYRIHRLNWDIETALTMPIKPTKITSI